MSLLTVYGSPPGRDKKFGTKDDVVTRPKQAIYNAANFSIILVPAKNLNFAQAFQLRVLAAGLLDSLGRPIDGNHDGQPGGDLVATIKKKTVTIQ